MTTKYVQIVHDFVGGQFMKGAVVRADRFSPTEIPRLEAAGAITDTDATEESPAAAPMSLDETVRSAQVTLPNIPHTDADPDTVRSKMGLPREAASVSTAQTTSSPEHQPDGGRQPSPSGKSMLEPQVAEALRSEEEQHKAS